MKKDMKHVLKAATLGVLLSAVMVKSGLSAEIQPGDTLSDKQILTYRLLDETTSFDPQVVEDYDGARIVADLFEGLYSQNKTGDIVPAIATRHEASEDKLTYTFHLRQNARWSDGKPVTAGDFVYAWRRAVDPELASPYAWYMELMSLKNASDIIKGEKKPSELGVSAPDDHTLVVQLSSPLPYFSQMVAHSTTFPSPRWTIEAHGKQWTKPGNIVSNGAYVLAEHVLKERSRRVRNPMYWNNAETIIEEVIALVIPDENQALTRYRAGELNLTDVPAGQYPTLKMELPGQIHSVPQLCNYYYTFNVSDGGPEAFKDVRVRQAMSYALDRSIIVDQVLQMGQFPAFTFTPAATAGFTPPEVAYGTMTQAERDTEARRLLSEAGYGKGGKPLAIRLLYNTSESHKAVAVVAAQMWKQKLGIDVTLANQEWKVFLENRGAQRFALARGAWCGDYNEASTFLDLLTTPSGYNDGKFSNSRVDELMTAARTSNDPSSLYREVEEILAREMPVIPVYHYSKAYVMDTNLKNWPFDNIQQDWLSKNLYFSAN